MSADKPNGNGGEPQKALPTLIIVLEPQSGEVMVKGPIPNKPLCFEMLAKAAHAVVQFDPSAQKKLISHVDPLAVKQMKGN